MISIDNKGETRKTVRGNLKTLKAQRSDTIFQKVKKTYHTSMIREGTSIFQHDTKINAHKKVILLHLGRLNCDTNIKPTK